MRSRAEPADDHALARELAARAGEHLLRLRAVGELHGPDLGRVGDRAAHQLLVRELRTRRPADGVRSEEGARRLGGASGTRLWIIDPLDGTREYGEPGRADWAVHVALTVAGRPVVGAVGVPARGLVFGTDRPPVLGAGRGPRLRVAVSRSRPPAVLERLCSALDVEVVPMGSAGVKTVAVLTGEVDAYLHAGGQYEWDSAAPVAVALAAGAHASRLDGSPLVYGSPSAYLPDLLVCHRDHRDRLLGALRVVSADPAGRARR